MTAIDRFLSKIKFDDVTGCWIWTGALQYGGYSVFKTEANKLTTGHRWSYERFVRPVPPGLELDHTCHNGTGCVGGPKCIHRRCVNPWHVEPVPHIVNHRRGNRGLELEAKKNLPETPRRKYPKTEAQKARDRERYLANREKSTARARRWYAEHKSRAAARAKARYALRKANDLGNTGISNQDGPGSIFPA